MTADQLKKLIAGCLKENQTCQKQLFAYTSEKVMQVCMRYCDDKEEARDLFQDSYIKIFSKLHQFDPNKGDLFAWIYSITKNTVFTHLKSKRIKYESLDENSSEEQQWSALDNDQFSQTEILNEIQKMPLGYRTVLNLFVFEEMSHSQIAELLNINESTSRSQLIRARNYLKIRLTMLNSTMYEKFNV